MKTTKLGNIITWGMLFLEAQTDMLRAETVDAGKPLKLVTRSLPAPPPRGALIKTAYAGVCHSDLHYLEDEVPAGKGKVFRVRDVLKSLGQSFSGIVLGHEIAGYIEKFGSDVKPDEAHLKVGDFVVVFPWVGCADCSVCSSGNSNMCANNPGGCWDFGQGHVNPGGYSTHVVTRTIDILLKVPNSVPKELACMLPCSASTAFSALNKAKRFLDEGISIRGEAKLFVIGAGGLGLWGVQLTKLMYPTGNVTVFIADINDDKLENAIQFGADVRVNLKSTYKNEDELVSDATDSAVDGGDQFDAAVDFVGSKETFETAFQKLRKGGTVVEVGLFGGTADLPLIELISKNVTIQGLRVLGLPLLSSFIQFLDGKRINYPIELVKLENINTVLENLLRGEISGRAIITHAQ